MNTRLPALVLSLLVSVQIAVAQTVSVWLTTDDQSRLMQQQAAVTLSATNSGTNCVVVDETQVYQQIEGFGAAFTDTTGYNLNEVAKPTARTNALQNLFTRNGNGIGLSFMRLPMGASDLARYAYSYDDLPAGQTDTNLSSFSIAHDQADIIPIIQAARQLNPQMKLMANPWSPPGWMKTSGSQIGGSLLASMYGPFANYFVKFIQAYRAQGIPIDYIGLQNEPLNVPSDYPGMSMDAATQTSVLRDYVLPALVANQLTNKVLVYDHNWDRPDYAQTVFADATLLASNQIAGTAWHGYGGTPGAMLTVANQYSSKGNYQTEHSGGTWVGDQVRADFEEIIHVMRSRGKCYVKWNLAGDQNDGPNSGGCSTCTPLVYVNSSSGLISCSADFYTLGHFSKFVMPGAYRIYSSDSANIISAAFLNPDGSKVVVAFNDTAVSNTFQVRWGTQVFSYSLASYAGATFTWAGVQTGAVVLTATNQIQASSFQSVSNLQTEATSDTTGGFDLGYSSAGSYALYRNVDFGAGCTNVSARLASAGSGGTIEFRLDGASGPLLGSVSVPLTGGWQTWQTQSGTAYGGSSLHNLYVVFQGSSGIGNLNWFQFGGAYPPLPSPWTSTDIGTVGLAGGASCSNGTFTVNGSGDDIWNNADAFHVVEQPVAGAYEIRARVVSVQNTDPWAKAGVVVRDGTAAGAINAAVVVTSGNGVAFQIRAAAGGTSTSTIVGGVAAPSWVRLVRTAGGAISGYYSTDGAHWTQVGSSVALSLGNGSYAGLAVTAHNNSLNCVVTFDNVAVNQAPILAPISNQVTVAGRIVTVSNSVIDADVPSQALSFSLLKSPLGSMVNTNSGLFTWRPTLAQSPTTQTVMVAVSDSGVPPMSATQSFSVTVGLPMRPSLAAERSTNGQFGFWVSGDAGPDYSIQVSTNLNTWSPLGSGTPTSLPWLWTDTNSAAFSSRFYRALLGP